VREQIERFNKALEMKAQFAAVEILPFDAAASGLSRGAQ
jgi:hypothetical protein